MEQTVGAWEYRQRSPASQAVSLHVWSAPRFVVGDVVTLPLSDPGVSIEVEWRTAAEDGLQPGEWQAGQPHEFGEATADFAVSLLAPRDFREDNIVRAIGVVRGHPACFELAMPKELMAAGESVMVEGKAFSAGPGIVLREVGELSSANSAFKIANVGPSQGALLPLAGPAVPSVLPFRGTFFARAGRLPADEVQLLIEQCQKA